MTWTPSAKTDETWADDRELTFVDGVWDNTRYWNVNDIWRNDPLWAGATGTAETWSEA